MTSLKCCCIPNDFGIEGNRAAFMRAHHVQGRRRLYCSAASTRLTQTRTEVLASHAASARGWLSTKEPTSVELRSQRDTSLRAPTRGIPALVSVSKVLESRESVGFKGGGLIRGGVTDVDA